MDLEVVIEGVPDVKEQSAIKRNIEQVYKATPGAGSWSVLVTPSEHRGRWDLGVRSSAGQRFVSFAEQAGQLPALVAAQLRACL
jgi:hypothetical protein